MSPVRPDSLRFRRSLGDTIANWYCENLEGFRRCGAACVTQRSTVLSAIQPTAVPMPMVRPVPADPANRLVADELETRWNTALGRVADFEAKIAAHDATIPARTQKTRPS